MAYNNLTGRTDISALQSEEVEQQIIQAAIEESAVLSLGRRLRNMTKHEEKLRVLDSLIDAYLVGATTASSGDSVAIQTAEAAWTNVYLRAAKLGVIVPIPKDVFEDNDYDVWGEYRPRIAEAFAKKIDSLVLHKANGAAPTDWPDGIQVYAAANSMSVDLSDTISAGGDLYSAVMGASGAIALVEENGYMPNGAIGALALRAKVRALRTTDGLPILASNPQSPTNYSFDGMPIKFPRNGGLDATAALMIVGDWSQLVYSFRKEIEYQILTEATIVDGSGLVQIALAQQDCIALKATMRWGWALPNPPNRIKTGTVASPSGRYPFAILKP
jgi:HK97 family phage major capsid protein